MVVDAKEFSRAAVREFDTPISVPDGRRVATFGVQIRTGQKPSVTVHDLGADDGISISEFSGVGSVLNEVLEMVQLSVALA